MSVPAPARVRFRERQRLRASDLQAEQGYLLGMAGRHATGPHTWGVVRGLEVSVTATQATIDPGIAIDAYGREIVLFAPIALELTAPINGLHVYIYYCEGPTDACGDAPAPRLRQFGGAAVIPDEWLVPGDEPSLGDALAAGPVVGAAPWPILLGIVRNTVSGPTVDTSSVRFAGLRAGRITAGSGRATMQLGAETVSDPYQFDVSIADAAAALRHRLAIDRDGNPIFWNNLEITGPEFKSPPIATAIHGVFLQATFKGGPGVRWRPVMSGGALTIQFLTRQGRVSTFQLAGARPTLTLLKKQIKTFNKTSTFATLSYVGKKSVAPAGAPAPAVAIDESTQTAPPSDGLLTFDLDDDNAPIPCGCDSADGVGAIPEGLLFPPGTSKLSPLGREITCVKLVDKDKQPYQEVRVSGGLKQDGDFTRHISIGGYEPTDFTDSKGYEYPDLKGKHFQPWLTVHGDGSIEIISRGQQLNGKFFNMLKAQRIALAPIKPDPRDPLFNYLLVLAFIKGVVSSSASVLGVTFKLPTLVESNSAWDYDVVLKNLGGTEALTAPPATMPETLSVDSIVKASSINVPAAAASIAPGASVSITVNHAAGDITIPSTATKLKIDVGLTMSAGSFKAGGEGSAQVEVVQTPEPTLTATAAVHGTPFDIRISVKNASGHDLVVTGVDVRVLRPNGSRLWPPAVGTIPLSTPVGAGQTSPVIPLTSPASQPTAPAGVGTDLKVTATCAYSWAGATARDGTTALTGTTAAPDITVTVT